MKFHLSLRQLPSGGRHPLDLLCLWLSTGALGLIAAADQWSYHSTDLHLSVLRPWDRFVFMWLMLAISLLALLPGVAMSSLLMARNRRRSAWTVFILSQMLGCLFLVGDLRIHRITGNHLTYYLPFILQPQVFVEAGGLQAIARQILTLACVPAILLAPLILGSRALVNLLRRRWHPPHRRRLLLAPPALYATVIMGAAMVQVHVRSFGQLSEFLEAAPFDLSRIGLGPTPPDRHPFEEALNRALPASSPVVSQWKQSLAHPPPADAHARLSRQNPPNVIILVVDSLRRDMLRPELMPHLYAYAQRGMVFDNHRPGVNCTHMAMFAICYGRYPMFRSPVLDHHIKPQLPAVFNRSGYETTYFQGYDDSQFHRMWEYVGPGGGFQQTLVRRHGDRWDRADLDILNTIRRKISRADRPKLCLALLSSVHFPYIYPPEFKKRRPVLDPRVTPISEIDWKSKRRALFNHYKNAVVYMDHLLGAFLDGIDLSRNLVLILGDHGESFGEDGFITHGGPMSSIVMNVPCVWLGAGVPNRRIRALTQHVDLLPTLLHLVEGRPLPVKHLQGFDILSQKTPRRFHLACPPNDNSNGIRFVVCGPEGQAEFYWSRQHHRIRFEGEVTAKGRLHAYDIPAPARASAIADEIVSILRLCSH